jgi:hypothetical protein
MSVLSKAIRKANKLVMGPIHASRTQQCPRAFVMEASIYLDISSKWRAKWLPPRGDPVQYSSFEALRIVGPGARSSFLDLRTA